MNVRSANTQIAAAVAIAVAVMTACAVIRWNDWTYGSDTGTFAQTVANAFSGFTNGMEGGTHFRYHFSPILALLWPLVSLLRTPLALQIAQVGLICLSVVPLAKIVENYVPAPWPARCAILALIYPPLLANAFSEFHELAFYPLLALTLFWAADRARWVVFAVCSVGLVLIREDACVDLIVIGAVFAAIGILRRDTRGRGFLLGEPIEPERLTVAGAALSTLSACALAAYAFVILPRTGPWAPAHFYEYSFAHGPVQTALSVITHPFALIRSIATVGRLTYLLEALVPLALLPFFTRWSLLSLPAFAGILLASDASVWRMGMHYVLLWAPWLVLAAAWQLTVLVRERAERAASTWWVSAVALCAIFLVAFDPMHPAHYLRPEPFVRPADIRRALLCVPANAPLATHDEIYAHEAIAYPHSSELGDNPQLFGGYLLYAQDWNSPLFARTLPAIQAALARGDFRIVCQSGNVRVLRRVVKSAAFGRVV